MIQATPTTYEMLLASGFNGDRSIDFLVGGEAFRASILPLVQNCKSFRNVYGPTETTIWSSSFSITRTYVRNARKQGKNVTIPIGKPISETVFYVVNPDGRPFTLVPDGEEGELWIGGIGVAAGYLNAPELTTDKFIVNPFGGERSFVYRTGDIVKKLTDGLLVGEFVFVRRIDDQVVIN